MAGGDASEITDLLEGWRLGRPAAEARLFEVVYPELRRIAHSLAMQQVDPALQPTALVHDLYLRLIGARDRTFENRKAFYRYAALAMQRMLIDSWRKQPKIPAVPIEWAQDGFFDDRAGDRLALCADVHRLLDEMEAIEPDWRQIVELKFYLGMDNPSVAECLGMSLTRVERRWHDARWWLFEQLSPQRTHRA